LRKLRALVDALISKGLRHEQVGDFVGRISPNHALISKGLRLIFRKVITVMSASEPCPDLKGIKTMSPLYLS